MSDVRIKTHFGEWLLREDDISPILGTTICRIVAPTAERIAKCFHDKPFLCLNRKQGVHHQFRGPHAALLQAIRIRDSEGGIGAHDVPQSARTRVLKLLEKHHHLRAILSTGAQFDESCQALAEGMGASYAEAQEQVAQMTLLAPDNEGVARILDETIDRQEQRLADIESISERLNWRAALITETILEQQDIVRRLRRHFELLHMRHLTIGQGYKGREGLIDDATKIYQWLSEANAPDRPFAAILERNRLDLHNYLHTVTRLSFDKGEPYLNRSVAAHNIFALYGDIQAVLVRITMGQARPGKYQREQSEKALSEVEQMLIRHHIQNGALLGHNPLPTVLARLTEARVLMGRQHRSWPEIKETLKAAAEALEG